MSIRLLGGSFVASLILCASLAAQVTQPGGPVQQLPKKAPYAVLTDSRVEVANFNPEPITGLVFDSTGRLWAVNPYASTIVSYSAITPAPDFIYPTGLNPVSIGVWEPTQDVRRILVACTGTHALLMHEPVGGAVIGLLRLDSEPADLVVDPDNDWAFVSCQGTNTVLKIDLVSFTIADRYTMAHGERCGPLYLDRGVPDIAEDNRVYVAATVSGNNSIAQGIVAGGGTVGRILDLETAISSGLPDEDVYRINPFQPPASAVASVIKRGGSLLFELDRNPLNGEMWILSFDSNNKDPAINTEPLLNGKLGINQLVTVSGVNSLSALITALPGIDLDDWDTATPMAQYAANRSLNQARTLDFLSAASGAAGWAFVAGPASDVIAIVDPTGNRVLDMNLPAGAQCYDLEIWNQNESLFVALCLGTMTIEVFSWSPFSATPVGSVPLGLDPTPAQVRSGRDVFLDGQRSADGRFTCGTCHPRGKSDQLGWMLRGHPCDEKDAMVTQDLMSIVDSFPHHWRGERDLDDFRKAFGGLLGDPSVPPLTDPSQDAVAADFVVFLQSLQCPANPVEDPNRILNDAKTATPAPNGDMGSAVDGQQWFRTIPNFNGQTCEGCHQQQSGSDSTYLDEVGSPAPRVAELEVAHLRQLTAKLEDEITITINNNPVEVNEEGFGAAHNGRLESVFSFIFDIVVFDALSDQQQVDTFMFVKQFDQGISPACHWGTRFTAANHSSTAGRLKGILIDGATKGWNDVAAFGIYDNGAGPVPVRWWFNPRAGLFLPDTQGLPSLTWTQFSADTQAGKASSTVLGLPPENGRRFGIDHDNDGLINGDEPAAGTDPWDPDFDGDGWPDGYEVLHLDDPLVAQVTSSDLTLPGTPITTLDFTTSRLAKFHLLANEDVNYSVSYGAVGFPQRTFTRDYFSRSDTFVLVFDEPSPPNLQGGLVFPPLGFGAQITLTDRNGNPAGPFNLTSFGSGEAAVQLPLLANHVADLQWVQQNRVGSSLDARVKIKIDTNYIDTNLPSPAWITQPNVMVFSTICVEDTTNGGFAKSTSFTTTLPTTFDIIPAGGGTPVPYLAEPGPPWIVSSLTDANGETTIDFIQPGLSPGQQLKVVVMGVVAPPAGMTPPPYDGFTLFTMQPLFLEDSQELPLPGGF